MLVVEDELYMAEAIRDGLRLEAIAADIAGDGDTALELLSINAYDIAVLDRDVPGPFGDEIAESIVASGGGTPILMLTAADRMDDKASGFELGADDYLTKPFELRELVLRLRALDRRRAHKRLLEAGLLSARSVGRSRLLSANADSRVAEPLTRLLEVTFGPQVVVAEEFAALAGVELVVIFGSWAARYEGVGGPPPNDVDVLVVGVPDREAVYAAADRAQERLGMQVNPVVRSGEKWSTGDDPLVTEIKASPKVVVRDVAASVA